MRYLLLLVVASTCWAHPTGERCLIHEAFVTPIFGKMMLESVGQPPPAPVDETEPPRPAPGLAWIAGYWAWAADVSDWIWVSGVWRKAPPGRGWIRGFWRELDEGWVRIPGFWSSQPLKELELIQETPPDPIEEEVGSPPGTDFFWMPGYWAHGEGYTWLLGGWQRFDRNWVLVPAHYDWRPGGFIFVESYWDWPLEARGVVYENAPSDVGADPYEPAIVVEWETLVERLFCCYPNYSLFFQHHHFFHPDFWGNWCCTPPWWEWNGWWGFTWRNSWALWWWWSHPGYPQPEWMTEALASQLRSPNQETILWMKRVHPPAIVTSRGVVRPRALARAMELISRRTLPVLPARPGRIIDKAERGLPKPSHVLRPTATEAVDGQLPKPLMVPGTLGESPEVGREAPLPKKPIVKGGRSVRRTDPRLRNHERLPGQRRPLHRAPPSRKRPWMRRQP